MRGGVADKTGSLLLWGMGGISSFKCIGMIGKRKILAIYKRKRDK